MAGDDQTTNLTIVTAVDSAVSRHVQALMRRALPVDLRDDRFDDWPRSAGGPFLAALATSATAGTGAGTPVGFLGGPVSGSGIALDALIDPDVADPGGLLGSLYTMLLPPIDEIDGPAVELWAKPARAWHTELAEAHGLLPYRALHQMRCRLPVEAAPISTRSFDPEKDLDALLSVNNRAFANHPDQGSQTLASLQASMAEPWFDPDGLRIHEREGRVAGFCWTKVHPERIDGAGDDVAPALGEIYVIGVDPDFHGQGLGVPMTAAGLSWLSDRGLTIGMLYVEADNVPAIKTYERLGFAVLRTDRAWLRQDPEEGASA